MSVRPDIVLLVLDTQRADRLSCYGHHQETSPHLDAFAADSTLFRYAISPAQWTIPVHGSLFTGLYPSSHNTLQASSRLPHTLLSLAERLQRGGYVTAGFCNNPLIGVVDTGMRRGFDSFLNYSGWLTNRPNQAGAHPGPVSIYRQWFKRQLSRIIVAAQDAFARSDALLAFSFTPFMVPLWQTALSFKGNSAKTLDDLARLHIERPGISRDKPIFSFVNLMGTHAPYHPPRRFIERFAPHILRDPEARRYLRRFNSDIYGWLAPLTGIIDDQRKATLDGIYDSEVAYQDELLGKFFQRLRASGRLDRTLVMICADHGDHLGEKQMIGHSFSLYNELIRVPLIVRDPQGNLPHASQIDTVVSTRRIFHTALAAASLANQTEGSLSLVQHGESDPDEGVAFAEAIPPQNVLNLLMRRHPELVRQHRCDQTRRAVSRGRYKLIQTGDQLELFDLHNDLAERVDLQAALPEQVEALHDLLDAFVSGTSAVAHPAGYATRNDDPLLKRRLKDLGYLE